MFDEALGRLHALGASAAALLPGLLAGLVVFALGLLMVRGVPTAHGWAIQAATDIAFALGVISLLGKRVPASLRVFSTALAIIDDLGAVVIIALFYTAGISLPDLAGAATVLAMLVAMNRFGLPLDALVASVTLGVRFGLVVGKVVGVLGCSLLATRLGWADMPAYAGRLQMAGTALLCGIGFTMSLFITLLAFPGDPLLQAEAKIGILAGSLVAGLLGYGLLRVAPQNWPSTKSRPAHDESLKPIWPN